MLEKLRGRFVGAVQVRDAVRNDVARRLFGAPRRRHHQRSAGGERSHGDAKTEDAAQRRCKQRGAVRIDRESFDDVESVRDYSTLVVQHELRRPGRARRGEDGAAGIRCRTIFEQWCTACEQSIRHGCLAEYRPRYLRACFVIGDDGLKLLERPRVAGSEDPGKVYPLELRPEQQHARARALQDVGQLVAAEARVDADGDGAELRAGEECGEPGGYVRQP